MTPSRFVRVVSQLAAVLGFAAASVFSASPASAQSLAGRPSCDGGIGASLVGKTPPSIMPANVVMIMIYLSGGIGNEYVDALRASLSPPHVTTVEELQAYQAKQLRVSNDLPTFFAQSRFARADANGTIACTGLTAGRYDVLIEAGGAGGSQSRMRYFLGHAAVPSGFRSKALVPMTTFSEIVPEQ